MVDVGPPADSGGINLAAFICHRIDQTHPAGIFYGQNPLEYSFTVILLEATLVILIIQTLRIILRPLKQPRIVSEILGGIIIGPSVLGRDKNFRKHVFPDSASYVFKNLGLIGFIYFNFLSGVKMDLKVIRQAGKKQYVLAFTGVFVPIFVASSIGFAIPNLVYLGTSKANYIGGVNGAFVITTFPVIYQVIKELNLVSSEMGRFTLSTVMISDVIGIGGIGFFEASRLHEKQPISALWFVISLVGMAILIYGMRLGMNWIVRRTPEGHPVEEFYIMTVLMSVLVIAFLSDITGAALATAPLWLGLAVPDGPPLGATLVDRAELLVTEFFMPFSFAFIGMYTDVSLISSANWSLLGPLLLMAIVSYLSKFLVLVFVARFFQMSFRESITLGLMSSLRGQIEVLLYMHWMEIQMTDLQSFSALVVLVALVTGIVTPLIGITYDPTKPYMINKRRALQYTAPNTEIHIVASIHDQESVTGLINLLEISNPTVSSPFSVYALRLIELVGRATTVFIDHGKQAQAFEYSIYNPIHNALKLFGESRGEFIKFHFFTSVSPKATMYQDICELALMKKSVLIILPFKKIGEGLDARSEVVTKKTLRSINSNVLVNSPCSVGILVDRRGPNSVTNISSARKFSHHFVVLFLGGADSREALAYADRMASNPDVTLTVIRFLAYNGEGDQELEKKLDDGVVTWFWVKNEGSQRVVYKEVVVRNGEETIASIHSINNEYYDLWIVGRNEGINPLLLQGLTSWSKNDELGVIGDYIAAMDFESNASVLVMQQQILRGQ